MNRRIRAPRVKVIDADGSMLGTLDTRDALAKAQEQSLDLVEVNAKVDPPVCKIIDYGKFKYEQAKKARESKKNRASNELKEVKFRPQIGDHDFGFKVKHARKFLEAGHKVKLVVQFRGRQMAHPETGRDILDRVCKELNDIITIVQVAKMEGRLMAMTVGPNPKAKAKVVGE
jgi:translation initiation factor IF-3